MALAFGVANVSYAGTFDLAFMADPDSRFFDFTSDAYAQIDRGYGGDQARDGFFFFQAEGQPISEGDEAGFDAFSPTVFSEITVGSNPNGADVFPQEQAFVDFEGLLSDVDLGRLDFEDSSGQITFLRLDLSPFAAPAHSPFNDPRGGGQFGYDTVILGDFGPDDRVTLSEGMVTGIDVSTEIRFDYRVNGVLVEGFTGEFRISGSRFDLFVDDVALLPTNAGLRSIRNAWDIEGAVLNLASVPGDYDADGSVTENDYQVWRSSFGLSLEAGTGADGNGDGVVDASDYTIWRDSFETGSVGVAVPSPTSFCCVSAGLLTWLVGSRRQTQHD